MNVSGAISPLTLLRKFSLMHTSFDLAALPASVTLLSLRDCIVGTPFIDALRCSRKLLHSFIVAVLYDDRFRVTGKVGSHSCSIVCPS